MNKRLSDIPLPALTLGVSGLLPFFAAATLVCALDTSGHSVNSATEWAVFALGAYGAVILSFLGGIRWGNLLNDQALISRWGPLTLSVVPSLIAWSALLLEKRSALLLLIAGFILQYTLDRAAVKRNELPNWFGQLRSILTTGALLSLSAAVICLSLQ